MKTGGKIAAIFLVLFSIVLGGFQEWVKININSNLEWSSKIVEYDLMDAEARALKVQELNKASKYSFYSSHNKIYWFYSFKSAELYRLKWILVPVFILLNFLLNWSVLFSLSMKTSALKWIYLFVISLAVIVFMLNKAVIHLDFFPFIRRSVLFLETIIPAAMLCFWELSGENLKRVNGK